MPRTASNPRARRVRRPTRIFSDTVAGTVMLVVALAILPILFGTGLVEYGRLNERRAEEAQVNLELARSVGKNFAGFVDNVLGNELAIGQAVLRSPPLLEPAVGNPYLAGIANPNGPAFSYSWLDPSGRVVATSTAGGQGLGLDLSDRDYYRAIAGGQPWSLSDLGIGRTTNLVALAIARAVRDPQGRLVGIVVAGVDVEQLGSTLAVRRSGGASVGVLDRTGRLVYRYPELPLTWEERAIPMETPAVHEALSGLDVLAGGVSPRDGVLRVTSYAPVPGLGWAAFASRPEEEIVAPLVARAAINGAVVLGCSAIAAIAALLASRRLTGALHDLRAGSIALGRTGRLVRVRIGGPAEVRQVGEAFNEMADRVERATETLRRSEQRYRTLADAVPDIVFTSDANGNLDYCNERWYSYTGLSPEATLGDGWISAIHPDDRSRVVEVWRAARVAAVPWEAEYRLLASDGRYAWFLGRSVPLIAEDGRVALWCGAAADIDAQKRVEDAERQAREAAEAAERAAREQTDVQARLNAELRELAHARDGALTEARAAISARNEFLSVAAHELKTPITSLRGFAQLLVRQIQRGEAVDPARLDRALREIDRQSGRISDLVLRLLDIGRLEAGRLALELEDADVARLVGDVAERLHASDPSRPFVVRAPGAIAARIDPVRIEQVVTNLLVNADKFSPSGMPVEVEVASTDDVVRVDVRDHGPGVPLEERARLFERFHQAHPARRGDAGLGLGLYVSRQLVELHGGRIWAEFPAEGGTRFVFEVPAAERWDAVGGERVAGVPA